MERWLVKFKRKDYAEVVVEADNAVEAMDVADKIDNIEYYIKSIKCRNWYIADVEKCDKI